MHSEADKEWKIEPASHKRGWWAGGYLYQGKWGTHQGQFVPVHHFPTVDGARIFVDAMKSGHSRRDAKASAEESAS